MKNSILLFFLFSVTCLQLQAQVDLPVTFEDMGLDYGLTDFGGNISEITGDPDPFDPANTVVKTTKPLGAELWAGTTIGGAAGFANPVPFAPGSTQMTVRVYSPQAGTPVRLKVEDSTDPAKSVETEALTTVVDTWETLTFDFANQAPGTAALNFSFVYDKASIFFNFGTDGNTAGELIYHWDDVEFLPGPPVLEIDLPVTFEDPALGDYGLTDFGGNISEITGDPDPIDPANTVVKTIKPLGAELWAGTTIGGAAGFATPVPFMPGSTQMTVRVYSPLAGTPIRLKVEDSADPTKSVETEALTTVVDTWETLTFDFSNPVAGTAGLNFSFVYDKASIFFNFGTDGNTAGELIYHWDDVEFLPGPPVLEIDLPVTFEDPALGDYGLTDFGGNISELTADPVDPANTVAKTTKPLGAELWAGTTIGGAAGFATPVPFMPGSTQMTVRVYSPLAGTPIRLKVEDSADPAKSVETEALTTVVDTWETLTFDFSNPVAGTAGLNFSFVYDKASIFFNFGTDGNTAGELIYHWDDVEFLPGPPLPEVDLPVTFEDPALGDYGLTDFGGNISELTADPVDPANTVAKTIKPLGAELWAGTTIGGAVGFATPVPFMPGSTQMTVRVYSPLAGTPIRLKVEDSADPTKSVETEALTTVVGTWETLTFDFSNPVAGTAALNFSFVYDKASIFFNFGTDGNTAGELIYHWDDVEFLPGPPLPEVDLPVTFEDPALGDYGLTDFGGNISEITADPVDPANTVVKTIKPLGAELWAGTTIGGAVGFANPVPFTADDTKMTVRVYSPLAGTPIRLKVEDSADPTKSVETEALTTVVDTWETLTFDFSNEVPGTAALNLSFVYDKASIFFNFGTDGNTAGELIYHWDDVEFFQAPPLEQIDLPVTFEENGVDYTLTDFGGNISELTADPADPANTVAQTTKPMGAELWSGTTIGTAAGFANAIPFEADATTMSVSVYSPDAGIPVRLKVEDSGDATKSVETEVMTTMANAWEVLVFDFTNEVAGTSPLDLGQVYDKASIFFNFGTDGNTAGEKVYYWDNVEFGGVIISVEEAAILDLQYFPNPVQGALQIKADSEVELVRILHTTGQEVYRTRPEASVFELDFSNYETGVYWVWLQASDQTRLIKVMKQ